MANNNAPQSGFSGRSAFSPATIGACRSADQPRVRGNPFCKRITTMFRKLAVALVATSLLAGPVLAQGTYNAPVTTGQPAVKADVKKVTVKKHVHKINKSRMHAGKAVKHAKHHVKHVKHVKTPGKTKTA